jgi:hypothetical protein
MNAEGRDEKGRDARDEKGRDEFGLPEVTAPPMPLIPDRFSELDLQKQCAILGHHSKHFQMMADAIEIADSCARSDIECNCGLHYEWTADGVSVKWYDTTRIDAEDGPHLEQALRYLDARGRINHHPEQPHLVNFEGIDS